MEGMVASVRIKEYVELVDTTLKPLLERKRESYEKLLATLEEWQELLIQLERLNEHRAAHWKSEIVDPNTAFPSEPFHILTDIGGGFRQHAMIEADHSICIDVGGGVFVDLKLSEALPFCKAKVKGLERLVADAQSDVVSVQADLMVSLAAIKTLQQTT